MRVMENRGIRHLSLSPLIFRGHTPPFFGGIRHLNIKALKYVLNTISIQVLNPLQIISSVLFK